MSASDALSKRMKDHENVTRSVLPRRTYTVVRLDGRAFHTFTRGLARPFDEQFAADMDAVAVDVVSDMSGVAFAYVASDEISVLLTDFAAPGTQPWFGGVVAKVVSLSAARATASMNLLRPPATAAAAPLFDSRVFTLPDAAEVAAYFVWRQRDTVKNAVSMAAQAHFGHKRTQGLHSGQLQELLFAEAGVNFNDYPDGFRRGRVVVRESSVEDVTFTHRRTGLVESVTVDRSRWVPRPAPHFTGRADDWLLTDAIPARPEPAAAY